MTKSLLPIVALLVVFAGFASFFPGAASADVVSLWNENFDEELSNSHGLPTDVGLLPMGDSEVVGTIFNFGDQDADIFTFSVGANQSLDSILLSIDGNRHFLGISEGTSISSFDASSMLVARLIGGSSDLLDYDPSDPNDLPQGGGGQGISSPLGPGDYTIWIQETALDNLWDYSFTFQTSMASAIPEPSSLVFLGAIGLVGGLRRHRRS